MSNVQARLASAFLLSVAASLALMAGPGSAARAADSCITEPKAETPQGKHWYYRIERGTGRHCWYLRGEDEASARTPAAEPVASAKPAPPDDRQCAAAIAGRRPCRVRAKGSVPRTTARRPRVRSGPIRRRRHSAPRRGDDGHRSRRRRAGGTCGFAAHLALAAGIGRAFNSERHAAGFAKVADAQARNGGDNACACGNSAGEPASDARGRLAAEARAGGVRRAGAGGDIRQPGLSAGRRPLAPTARGALAAAAAGFTVARG